MLPWLLSKPPTEGDRRLAESEAHYRSDESRLSEREDYYEARQRSRDEEVVSLAAQKWYEELLKRHPERQVEFRNVPDEDNGFLQYLNLLAEHGCEMGNGRFLDEEFGPELLAMLNGLSEWDPEALDTWIKKHEALYLQLLDIAELPDRSVKGIDIERYSFISARPARSMGLLLQGAARLAMESGDHDTAHRLYKATLNQASHLDQNELNSLLAKTVSIILRIDALESFQRNILPHIADDPDKLSQWRETLSFHDEPTTVLPDLMNSEWHIVTRTILLPMLLTGDATAGSDGRGDPIHIPDQDAFLEAFTAQNQLIMDTAASSLPLSEAASPTLGKDPALSEGANEAMGMVYVGFQAWSKGLHRSNTRSAMNDALIAVRLGEDLPLDPTTGEPFLWDPDTRTLSAPEGTTDIEALHVP